MFRKLAWLLPLALVATLLSLVPAQDAPPKKFALLIGVNKYTKPGFDELKYAEADVIALSEVLKADGFEVKLLLGSATGADQATQKNIDAALAEFVPKATVRDTLIVAMSGHGQELDGKPYFCPVDGLNRTPASLVSVARVVDVAELHAGVRVVFVDACRNDPDPTKGRGIDRNTITLKANSALFLSCASNQKALESETLKHGLFFHCVLEGMRGALKDAVNANGEVTPGRLATAVEETFAAKFDEWAPKASRKQEPQIANYIPASRVLIAKTGLASLPKPGEERDFEIYTGVKMTFCWIPPGKAILGSPASEEGRFKDEVEHEFNCKGFWLGKYEVTQAEWTAVIGSNPSYFDGMKDSKAKGLDTTRYPVETVSWDDCQKFLEKVNQPSKKPFRKIALPHEDEWEYACRGGKGNQQPYYWGKAITAQEANTSMAKLDRTAIVGSYAKAAPHPWGLCDMTGNVFEWCENRYSSDSQLRILRGGSWFYDPESCRAAFRNGFVPGFRFYDVGFRVVLDL